MNLKFKFWFELSFTLGWLGYTYQRSYMFTASLTSMLWWCTWHDVFWWEQMNYLTWMYNLSSTWAWRFSLNINIGSHNRCVLSNSSFLSMMQHAAPKHPKVWIFIHLQGWLQHKNLILWLPTASNIWILAGINVII